MARLDRCYNIADMRDCARRRLPKGVFEYIDRGAEDEIALADNREVFRRLKLRTKFMVDLTDRDMGVDIFGKRMEMPFVISPTGVAGLAWYQGELALARAAAAKGVPFTLATGSITAMERIAEAGGRLWFQLYMWREEELSYQLVGRARDAGFEALVVTIDGALGNNREYNKRNGFSIPFTMSPRSVTDMVLHPEWLLGVMGRYMATTGMPRHENYPAQYAHRITVGTGAQKGKGNPARHQAMTWADIRKLRDFWPGKLIVKGILRAEDAERRWKAGPTASSSRTTAGARSMPPRRRSRSCPRWWPRSAARPRYSSTAGSGAAATWSRRWRSAPMPCSAAAPRSTASRPRASRVRRRRSRSSRPSSRRPWPMSAAAASRS